MTRGYVMLLLDVHDRQGYEEYLEKASPTVAAHGGRFVFASDNPDVVEGQWPAGRTIMIEFDSMPAARAWYESSSYEPLVAARRATSDSHVAIFEGG